MASLNLTVMTVSQSNRGVTLDINASMLFKPGEAAVQADAVQTLADVAKILPEEELAIEVEGHTDNLPISNAQFPSNWELSSARASSVVRLFIEQGIISTRLKATGLADNVPIEENSSIEGRARNRRVAVTVLTPESEQAEASASSQSN